MQRCTVKNHSFLWSVCATSRIYSKIYLWHLLLNSEYFSRCSFSQNVLVSLNCMVACIPLLSLTCTASTAGQNTCKTQQEWKKSLAICTETRSYIKVKAATALRAGSEAASELSTSADTEISVLDGECNERTNASLWTAAVSALNTGKSSTLKRTLDCPFDSVYQIENS